MYEYGQSIRFVETGRFSAYCVLPHCPTCYELAHCFLNVFWGVLVAWLQLPTQNAVSQPTHPNRTQAQTLSSLITSAVRDNSTIVLGQPTHLSRRSSCPCSRKRDSGTLFLCRKRRNTRYLLGTSIWEEFARQKITNTSYLVARCNGC